MIFSKPLYLTKETFSDVTQQVHDTLLKKGVTNKEVLRADLLLEETFLRMTGGGMHLSL